MKKILILILLLATISRFYQLASIPPSLGWDEAAVGYDAFSIAQTGYDQWGNFLPLSFRSFGEYKSPIHIYTVALFVKLFGLSDLVVLLPFAILGVINVYLTYLLVDRLYKSQKISLVAAFLTAISPWAIQFSRVVWEFNFVYFFFLSGLILFFDSLQKRWKIVPACLMFGLSLLSYNAAKIFIPIFLVGLVFLYSKELIKKPVMLTIALIVFGVFLLPTFLSNDLNGSVRFSQVDIDNNSIINTYLYKTTGNHKLGRVEIYAKQYLSHLSVKYLYISGDKNLRHSSGYSGEFLWPLIIFLPLGFIALVRQKKKESLILLGWLLVSIIPGAITKDAPHASRSLFLMESSLVTSSLGLILVYDLLKQRYKTVYLYSAVSVLMLFFGIFIYQYMNGYSTKSSTEWQYEYNQFFINYKNDFKNYSHVYVTDRYGQPYIFALYNLKYNPQDYRKSMVMTDSDEWGSSAVRSFDRFIFKKVNQQDYDVPNSLFAVSPEDIQPVGKTPIDTIYYLNGQVGLLVYQTK